MKQKKSPLASCQTFEPMRNCDGKKSLNEDSIEREDYDGTKFKHTLKKKKIATFCLIECDGYY